MPKEPEAQVEAPILQHREEPQADTGVHPPREEVTPVDGGRSKHGSEASKEERRVDMVPYEEEGHPYPIVDFKGKKFYAIQRYGSGRDTAYTEYREVGAPLQGNGTVPAITSDKSSELAELRRSDSLQRKTERRKVYEEAVYDALSDVAKLQIDIVGLANDPSAVMDHDEIAKAKLGLQAAESILNRALGKPVTKIDAEVSMSVADSMLSMAEDWVIEDAEEA